VADLVADPARNHRQDHELGNVEGEVDDTSEQGPGKQTGKHNDDACGDGSAGATLFYRLGGLWATRLWRGQGSGAGTICDERRGWPLGHPRSATCRLARRTAKGAADQALAFGEAVETIGHVASVRPSRAASALRLGQVSSVGPVLPEEALDFGCEPLARGRREVRGFSGWSWLCVLGALFLSLFVLGFEAVHVGHRVFV
jgi:hypothetical protein